MDCPFLPLLFLPRSSVQSESAPLVCILDKQPSIFAVVGLALFSLHGCPGCPLAVCLPCLHAVRSLFYLLRVRFMYDVYVWQKCGATVKKKKKKGLHCWGLAFLSLGAWSIKIAASPHATSHCNRVPVPFSQQSLGLCVSVFFWVAGLRATRFGTPP